VILLQSLLATGKVEAVVVGLLQEAAVVAEIVVLEIGWV
jgi:hypothetical protein